MELQFQNLLPLKLGSKQGLNQLESVKSKR